MTQTSYNTKKPIGMHIPGQPVAVTLPYKWEPWPHQENFWNAMMIENKKRAVVVWHRRAGKDQTALNILVCKAFERVGMYWYVFPEYKQGREIFWDGMRDDGRRFIDAIPPELIARKRDDLMMIELKNGSMIKVIGTDNADSIVGPNPVGCIFSEFSIQNPTAWNLVRPILNANNGWAIFVYTPRGYNHAYELYRNALELSVTDSSKWFCELLTIDDTSKMLIGEDGQFKRDEQDEIVWGPVVTQEQIEEDIKTGMSKELVEQEYYCSFEAALTGSYYSDLISLVRKESRLTKVPYNTDYPVHTAWDLGLDDSTAIWFFQLIDDEIRIIDYEEYSNVPLKDVIVKIKEKPYVYGTHIGPHDISTREFTTGESRYNFAKRHGIRFQIAPKLSILDGIEAVRRIFNRCKFDETKCTLGFDALTNYRKKFDDVRKVYDTKPHRDWTTHGADAFRYLALGLNHILDWIPPSEQGGVAGSYYNIYTHTDNPDKYVAGSDYDVYSHYS